MGLSIIKGESIFCIEKRVNRILRERFKGCEKAKMILLYHSIAEIDSDISGDIIYSYASTIAEYSGLNIDFIRKGVRYLEYIDVINILETRSKNGMTVGKGIILFHNI